MSDSQKDSVAEDLTSIGGDGGRFPGESSNRDLEVSFETMPSAALALGMLYVDTAHTTRRTLDDMADERQRSLTLGRSVTAAAVELILGVSVVKPAATRI